MLNGSILVFNPLKNPLTTLPRFLKSSIRLGISSIKSLIPPNPWAIAIPDCTLINTFSKFSDDLPVKDIAAFKAEYALANPLADFCIVSNRLAEVLASALIDALISFNWDCLEANWDKTSLYSSVPIVMSPKVFFKALISLFKPLIEFSDCLVSILITLFISVAIIQYN